MSDSANPWTVAYQAPLSMGFSRQEYWSGLPFPSPGDLPDPGIKPRSPSLQADSLPAEPPGKPSYVSGPILNAQYILKDYIFISTLCDENYYVYLSLFGLLLQTIID